MSDHVYALDVKGSSDAFFSLAASCLELAVRNGLSMTCLKPVLILKQQACLAYRGNAEAPFTME